MLIALYPRVSTQEQAEHGHSINEQIDRMKKYCDAMGWSVYKIYTDAGYSGGNTERPGLQSMITDVKAGKVDKVLVYKLDRLSRSQLDTLYLIEKIFLANNVDFVSMSENFDTSTPFGRAMIGILAVFAQLEREQIKERMKMGKYARAKKGKFHGSNNIPTGYDYDPQIGEFITNDFEKMQVIECFQLAATGISPYKIAKILDAKGFVRRSGPWNDRNIRRTLRNKAYIGYQKYNNEWFESHHEHFVSDELFYKVQEILDNRSAQHEKLNRRVGKATTYLGGFLYCAHCGAKYCKSTSCPPKKSGGTYRYEKFMCYSRQSRTPHMIKDKNCKNKHWNVQELTDLVFGEIKKLAIDPNYIAAIKDAKPEDEQPQIIAKELDSIDKQISRLMDVYTLGNMPLDIVQDKIHELNDKKVKLNNELEEIKKENDKKLSQAEAVELVQSFSEILDRGNFDEIRAVLSELIEKIVIDNEDITIHWAFV